jgi:type IV pilus assembly protein PilB
LLLDSGVIDDEQLEIALDEQKTNGGMIGNILVSKGFVDKDTLYHYLERQVGVEYIDLDKCPISEEAIQLTPRKIAKKHNLIPIKVEDGALTVVMADPLNIFAIDDLRLSTGHDIKVLLGDIEIITNLLLEYYPQDEEEDKEIEEELEEEQAVDFDEEMEKVQEEIEVEVQEIQQSETTINFNDVENAPIVRMLNMIFKNAVGKGASDIHIEAYEDCVMVRFRIDGKLVEITKHDKKLHPILVARVKIISGLNIAERRIPQDGRITLKINNKNYDFRVSILPTVFGEKVVIRIADKEDFARPKSELGFTEEDLTKFNRMLAHPNGIVLVTGPTGSGKSTTLAAMIEYINSTRRCHIVTIEDPIEYLHKHKQSVINQRELGSDTMSFTNALRAALREDPDVILVGEMRDIDTISVALTAAETGHLVFSTLHTLGAAKTVDRIIDVFMPYQQAQVRSQLSTVLQGIVSQQLVRRADNSGRIAATEIMLITPAISNMIREARTVQINSSIHTGSEFGMHSMDASLAQLYKERIITLETAKEHAVDPVALNKLITVG